MSEFLKVDKAIALEIALSMYLDEPCAICGKMFEILEDLDGAVWAGYSNSRPGRIAHAKCWEEQNAKASP